MVAAATSYGGNDDEVWCDKEDEDEICNFICQIEYRSVMLRKRKMRRRNTTPSGSTRMVKRIRKKSKRKQRDVEVEGKMDEEKLSVIC